LAPNDSEWTDPRAYRRLAAMIRREISEGRRHRQSPASAGITGTRGKRAARLCACWSVKDSWRAFPGSATTCVDASPTRNGRGWCVLPQPLETRSRPHRTRSTSSTARVVAASLELPRGSRRALRQQREAGPTRRVRCGQSGSPGAHPPDWHVRDTAPSGRARRDAALCGCKWTELPFTWTLSLWTAP
jgi:hypothetical protein